MPELPRVRAPNHGLCQTRKRKSRRPINERQDPCPKELTNPVRPKMQQQNRCLRQTRNMMSRARSMSNSRTAPRSFLFPLQNAQGSYDRAKPNRQNLRIQRVPREMDPLRT